MELSTTVLDVQALRKRASPSELQRQFESIPLHAASLQDLPTQQCRPLCRCAFGCGWRGGGLLACREDSVGDSRCVGGIWASARVAVLVVRSVCVGGG